MIGQQITRGISTQSPCLQAAALSLAEDDGLVSYTTSRSTSKFPSPSPLSKIPSSSFSTTRSTPQQTTSLPVAKSSSGGPKSGLIDPAEGLDLFRKESKYYAIVEIKNRPYFVNSHDIIITMRMNELQLGDVISLDRVREIGSADYTLEGNPYIDPKYFSINAVVIEHPVNKETVAIHRKRRNRNKVVFNHSHHTALRISSIEINKHAA
ncbi:hypothetical protein DFS34DRAFT_224284 [Phlyctochytrium arcticum]|nr:hypothetical protein DFS34DRAFT_224284 [Phlyctochytrium arcticum]